MYNSLYFILASLRFKKRKTYYYGKTLVFLFKKTLYIYYTLIKPLRLTPLTVQPDSFFRGFVLEVITTKYCMSLQVRLLLASNAKAQRPAAIGAEADVPNLNKYILMLKLIYTIEYDLLINESKSQKWL